MDVWFVSFLSAYATKLGVRTIVRICCFLPPPEFEERKSVMSNVVSSPGGETLFDVSGPGMRREKFSFLRLSLVWEKISLCSTVLRHVINEHGKEETKHPSLPAISPPKVNFVTQVLVTTHYR